MRTLLKVSPEVEAGNQAVRDGSVGKILESVATMIQPEAAYFFAEEGQRTALFVFDLKDPSQIPQISEPLFQALNAEVQFIPVMNQDELVQGLSAWAETL